MDRTFSTAYQDKSRDVSKESFREGWPSKTDTWKSCCFTNTVFSKASDPSCVWQMSSSLAGTAWRTQRIHRTSEGPERIQGKQPQVTGVFTRFSSGILYTKLWERNLQLSSWSFSSPMILLMPHSISISSVKKLPHSKSPSPWQRAQAILHATWRIPAAAAKLPHQNSMAQQ